MKDNIEGKYIGNRKIVIEIRFEPKVVMLDKRGELVEKLQNTEAFNVFHWEIDQADVTLRDTVEKEEAANVVVVSFNRFSLLSSKIDSIDAYYEKFKKLYQAMLDVLGKVTVKRIGCRIIGSYKVKSTDYANLLASFKESFPSKFYLEKYPSKDLLFRLDYDNGMYQIGPLNIDDNFYAREFKQSSTKKHVGIAIDTDNYLTNELKSINDMSLIKNVYELSLSIEKELLSNLSDF